MDVKRILMTMLIAALYGQGSGQSEPRQYCIVGAGPGGLQLGYFLHRAGSDYVIFEKNSIVGSFFTKYPRHRTLISINKRNTGSHNKEFTFRHDWNSLISDDETLQMRYYSQKYFPPADDYVRYLRDFADRLELNVQFQNEITEITRDRNETGMFQLRNQNGTNYSCRVVIISTGLWVPNIPWELSGIEHAVGYESVSINPEDFEGKVVLILGRGNSGFETADNIVGNAAYIHMIGRSRIKMAYQTHYVGDLRAINNNLVDTYQLKSLDAQIETEFSRQLTDSGMRLEKGEDGKFRVLQPKDQALNDNLGLYKYPYDCVIRCLGFKFDFSIFNDTARLRAHPTAGRDKYPHIKPNYEAVHVPDMFVAGTASHSLDFKKAAGAFIHGFRYTARALFRYLQWRYHGIPWPSTLLHSSDLLNHFVRRINEASGPYQMFGQLVDVALIRDNNTVVYLEEVPLQAFPMFQELTGHQIERFIIWNFEYGKDYSGPDKDVLRSNRAVGDPEFGDLSNFLHPVLYYYEDPPNPKSVWVSGSLPYPTLYHHVVEDLLTDWTARHAHIIPLRRFLEGVMGTDLREFFAETCFELILTHGDNVPLSCKHHYLQGVGITSLDGTVNFGPAASLGL